MINIQASISKGWVHNELGINFDREYYFDPLYRLKRDREIAAFLEERFPRYRIHNLESNLVVLPHYSPDLAYVGGIQPNLIMGMLLGADFIAYNHQDADISESPLKGLDRIEDLPSPGSLIDHSLITQWTGELVRLKSKGYEVVPPFFWDKSGRATIHGFITTALKFFGQDVFLSIYDNPDKVRGFFRWYGEASARLIDHFAEAAEREITGLHIGECSGTMLSPRDYSEFLGEALENVARAIGPIRLHHCGDCTHLLPEIKKVNGVVSLDTGSGTDVSAVREILGPDFPLDLMPPVDLLSRDSKREELIEWLRKTLRENQNGPLTINYHLEPGYDEENHLILHEELYDMGLVKPGRR